MKEINATDDVISAAHNYFCNSSTIQSFEGEEHEFHNPQLHQPDKLQVVLYGYILPILAFISVISNILIIATLNRVKEASPSLDMILRHLSIYDMGVTILSVLLFTVPTILGMNDPKTAYLNQTHPMMIPYLIPLLHMAITGCDYLNVAVVAERYLAIDRYYQNKKSIHQGCLPSKTKYYIFCIQLLTIAFNIPGFWELKTVDQVNGIESAVTTIQSEPIEVIYEVVPTCLRHHKIYESMYRLMAELLIFKITPWLTFLVLFLTIKGRIGYFCKRRNRRFLTNHQYHELKDARIVLGTIVLFYLTNILPFYVSFCHILLYNVSEVVAKLAHFGLVVNSSFKFLIYIALSRRFRSGFISLFKKEVPETNTSNENELVVLKPLKRKPRKPKSDENK